MAEPTTSDAMRAVFRTALRDVLLLTVAVTVVGTVLGVVLVGQRGLWGGILGGVVVLLVGGTTPITMLLTARASLTAALGAVAGGWLVKTVIVLVAVVALRGADLVDPRVLTLVVVAGLLGSVAVDARAVLSGRVPYIDTGAATQPGDSREPSGEADSE